MPTLWTFNFDAPCHFSEAEYIFDFEDRQYRLIRGTEEECDKLLTVSDDSSSKGTEECFERTMRLLDYLSWELKFGIKLLGGFGHGFKEGTLKVETTPVGGYRKRRLDNYNVKISSIPDITNDVQIDALSLWNEAQISASPFLAFINYWKIIELFPAGIKPRGSPEKRAIAWINSVPDSRIIYLAELKREIIGKYKTVGEYLYQECRNAIAHITRIPTLKPSKFEDYNKIHKPKLVMEALTRFYIQKELELSTYSKPLKILKTKKRTKAFPLLKEFKKQEKEARKKFFYYKRKDDN